MSTFIYNNVEYTQVFIDPSKTIAGDGTTPENALFDFPTTLASNTAYIIRRTNDKPNTLPQIPNGTYDVANLIITGMPKETDLLYKFMNKAEKDAWGADEFDYAMCRVNNTTANQPAVTFSAINDFIINRCYLFRDENEVSANNVREYAFNITSTSACTTISNCKWNSFLGDDFEKDEWLAANTKPNDKARPLFVIAPNTNSFSLHNNIINATGCFISHSSGVYCRLFELTAISNISITSNIINTCAKDNSVAYTNDTYFAAFLADNSKDVVIEDNTFNIVDHGDIHTPLFRQILINTDVDYTTTTVFKNTTVRYKQMKDNVPVLREYGQQLFSFNNLTHYQVENFDFDIRNSDYACFYYPVLCVSSYYSRSPNNIINNISIKFNTEGSLAQYGLNNSNSGALIIVQKDTINCSSSNSYTPIFIPSVVKATNINVEVGEGCALSMCGTCVEAQNIRGHIFLDGKNYLKVNTLTNPRGDYRAIYCNSQMSTIQIDTLNVIKDNAKYPYDSSIDQIQFSNIEIGYAQNIFINHCNTLPFALTTYSTTTKYGREATWVANDYNGLFIARNASATAKSWGVTRAGTKAQASFKFETTVDSKDNELILGCNPCTGFLLTPDSTGDKTITAYFGSSRTYNSFAGINNKIWIEALVKQEDGSITTYRSNALGSIEQDDSTWEGDSGVQPMKVVLPVNVPTTDPVEVKVHFHWFDSIGYTYLDPELHID